MRIRLSPTDGSTADESSPIDEEREEKASQDPREEDDSGTDTAGQNSTQDDDVDVPDVQMFPEEDLDVNTEDLQNPQEPPDSGGLFGRIAGGLFGGSGRASGSTSGTTQEWNRLLVVGEGPTEHTYEIGMQEGGEIRKASHAGSNDNTVENAAGNQAVTGSIWHWNADSYAYTGEIAYIRGNGTVALHFPGGAFETATKLHLRGQDGGTHQYALATNNADIDPVPGTTEQTDRDHDGKSEQRHTADHVFGEIGGRKHDSYDLGDGDPLQYVAITDGHLRLSR